MAVPSSDLPGCEETSVVFDGPAGRVRTKCLLFRGDQWVPLSVVARVLSKAGFDVEASEIPEQDPEQPEETSDGEE